MSNAPQPGTRGWDIAEVARFISKASASETTLSKSDPTIAALKARELTARCARMEWRLAREKSEYVRQADIASAITRILGGVAQVLEARLQNELPTVMSGLSVPEARVYGRKLYDEIMVAFQKLGAEFPE